MEWKKQTRDYTTSAAGTVPRHGRAGCAHGAGVGLDTRAFHEWLHPLVDILSRCEAGRRVPMEMRGGRYTAAMNRLFRDAAGSCLAPGGSVVCVGAFDGVHRGHQALLAQTRARASASGMAAVAISFEPIPREFFARGEPVARLSGVREKIERIFAAGIDTLLVLRFDARMASMSAESFVEDILVSRAGAREIRVGEDFRFGRAREGDVDRLRVLGRRHGFAVDVMPDVGHGADRASSSTIRRQLAAGDFEGAASMLGRPFAIGGRVVRGLQLGRRLGWPTANLRLGRRVSPVCGIFAVRVRGVTATSRPGVASLGMRPTVGGTEPLLEVHLFDFDGDLYGRRIEVEFVRKLRDESKFDDLDAMVRQIERDAAEARMTLGTPIPRERAATV